MKTKEEILEKVSEIIDTSKDEQVILNASHFIYDAIVAKENEEKLELEREKSRERMKPMYEMIKTFAEV